MPTFTENLNKADTGVNALGILAGGGALPSRLIKSCQEQGITVFVVAFDGQTDPKTIEGCDHIWVSLGSAGKIIKTLKNHSIVDLVMIGSIRRPSLGQIKPDFKGAEIIARIGLKARGDNNLLMLLRTELEKEGFRLHGIQKFMCDLLTPKGTLGKFIPDQKHMLSIDKGICIAKILGEQDIGQSVIIQNDLIIALEGIEGTDALMRRSKDLLRPGVGAILVKACKPQQDKDLDLPTIGPDTIRTAHLSGLSGIAIEAHNSLMVDAQELIELADQHKMFVFGFTTNNSG